MRAFVCLPTASGTQGSGLLRQGGGQAQPAPAPALAINPSAHPALPLPRSCRAAAPAPHTLPIHPGSGGAAGWDFRGWCRGAAAAKCPWDWMGWGSGCCGVVRERRALRPGAVQGAEPHHGQEQAGACLLPGLGPSLVSRCCALPRHGLWFTAGAGDRAQSPLPWRGSLIWHEH